jgi:small-conductance mechanosensitive channel
VVQATGGVRLFGIELIGVTPQNGKKLLATLVVCVAAWVLARLLRIAAKALMRKRTDLRAKFWSEQAIHIAITVLLIVLLVSLWFDNPTRLAGPAGLLSAGLAVALQRVITAIAGYFVILSGQIFSVGDRIVMGGVRGDVIALGYTRTKIMEMGEPPPVQAAEPAVWITARQYTGRIVTVTNDTIFDSAVYNYTREFPYIWEEMRLPVRYQDDWHQAERILLDVAREHTIDIATIGKEAVENLKRTYVVGETDLHPRVFWRITDNWLELTVRFVSRERGVRELKDAMAREILKRMKEAGLEVASATYDVVGFPPIEIKRLPSTETA